jgi:hypothetical protein
MKHIIAAVLIVALSGCATDSKAKVSVHATQTPDGAVSRDLTVLLTGEALAKGNIDWHDTNKNTGDPAMFSLAGDAGVKSSEAQIAQANGLAALMSKVPETIGDLAGLVTQIGAAPAEVAGSPSAKLDLIRSIIERFMALRKP